MVSRLDRGARRSLFALALTLLLFVLPACGPPAEIADLRAIGVRTQEYGRGWYRFRSDDGYSFQMPGVPLSERQTYAIAGARVDAIFYDLTAELGSRGYLLRAFDARELDRAQREELREQAEAMIVRSNEASEPRRVPTRGVEAVERVVQGLSINGHFGVLRTMVLGPFVFQLLVVLPPSAGDPGDARQFFESVRLTGSPSSRTGT
jgi:hypothetical protein